MIFGGKFLASVAVAAMTMGVAVGNGQPDFFPAVVDVGLYAQCYVLPPSLPVDFVMTKVMERFDEVEPGYTHVDGGQPLPDDWVDPNLDPLAMNVGEAERRRMRNLRAAAGEGVADVDDYHRRLVINVCKKCQNAKRFKRCIKNKCSGKTGRRRQLKGYDWSKSSALQDALDASEEVSKIAAKDKASATKKSAMGKTDLAAAHSEKASILEEMAGLYAKKAQYLQQRKELFDRQDKLLEKSGVDGTVVTDWKKVLNDVARILNAMTDNKQDLKDIDELAAEKEELIKLTKGYEKTWTKAIDAMDVTEAQLKSVGKMEKALNQVVQEFTRKYGCELGIVVSRLA